MGLKLLNVENIYNLNIKVRGLSGNLFKLGKPLASGYFTNHPVKEFVQK